MLRHKRHSPSTTGDLRGRLQLVEHVKLPAGMHNAFDRLDKAALLQIAQDLVHLLLLLQTRLVSEILDPDAWTQQDTDRVSF